MENLFLLFLLSLSLTPSYARGPSQLCSRSLADQIFVNDQKGDLPSAKDLGKLVNLENVKNSIGDPVTDDQKLEIKKDLEKALDNFIDRETTSTGASFIIPFVTVNNRTDIVAIHSRLLLALQLSVVDSVKRLDIEPDSGAFDELERAADDICRGESVDCRDFLTVRRIDGKCNNLKNQETENWGATAIGMRRLTSPAYGEPDKPDLHLPRKVNVSPRDVSNALHRTRGATKLSTKGFTHMVMQFGQFLDHDITLTPEGELECCEQEVLEEDIALPDPIQRCFNIPVKGGDPEFQFRGSEPCFPFTRSDIFCPRQGEPREQINGITAFIDGSNIYGSDEETSIGLRTVVEVKAPGGRGRTKTFPGALLKTQLSVGHNKALPARSQCGFATPMPTEENPNPNPTPDDLTSGDVRAVVQPALTSIHTLFLHEHNRIVDALQPLWKVHPETKDLPKHTREKFIFEVARMLVGAELQQITYREFLPVVLGNTALGNLAKTETFYDQNVDPSILNEFATIAFRFGHSIIDNEFQGIYFWALKDHFFDRDGDNPTFGTFVLGNRWQHEMMGLANQTAPELDLAISDSIRNTLFTNRQNRPEDLVARNIQRGRDHGIPGYDKLRRACGMTDIIGPNQAPPEITAEIWRNLMKTYNNDPSMIDGFTAGLAETAPRDGMVGPLFACIMRRQFEALRDGDRFFFSHRRNGERSRPQGLHPVAKENIRGRSLGAVYCDNLDASVRESVSFPRTVGQNIFRTPNPRTNPELDCRKLKLGNGFLDLQKIFNETVAEKGGLSSILTKAVKDEKEKDQDTVEEGFVQSVNFPLHYLNSFDETTKLEVAEGNVVEIEIHVFELERDPIGLCRFDFVEIFESNGKGIYEKLCGDNVASGTKFKSKGNELTVKFHSDRAGNHKGFRAAWKEVQA